MSPMHRLATPVFAFMATCGTSAFMSPSLSPINLHRKPTRDMNDVMYPNQIVVSQHGASLLASSSVLPPNDPRVEPRTTHKVKVNLPLGLVLEDMDSDPTYGVVIIGINEGNAAKYNAAVFSRIKSQERNINCRNECICIRDKIMSVNGTPCDDKGFDDVIELISSTQSDSVTMELGRIQDSTVLNYYNGICISAKPGESYGFLADKLGISIDYECRTGNCLTCARFLEFPDKERDLKTNEGNQNLYERTILHCVGRVPKGYQWLHVLDYTVKTSEDDSRG